MSMSRRQKIEDRAWGTICCKTGRQAWAENYLTHMDNHWRKFSSTCTRLTVNPAGEVHAYVHTGCSQASSRWPQLGYATACHLFFFLLLLFFFFFFFLFCSSSPEHPAGFKSHVVVPSRSQSVSHPKRRLWALKRAERTFRTLLLDSPVLLVRGTLTRLFNFCWMSVSPWRRECSGKIRQKLKGKATERLHWPS